MWLVLEGLLLGHDGAILLQSDWRPGVVLRSGPAIIHKHRRISDGSSIDGGPQILGASSSFTLNISQPPTGPRLDSCPGRDCVAERQLGLSEVAEAHEDDREDSLQTTAHGVDSSVTTLTTYCEAAKVERVPTVKWSVIGGSAACESWVLRCACARAVPLEV